MKKVFIIVGIILLSIMMSSCNKLKEETRVLGGCVYTDREDLRECTSPDAPTNNFIGFIFDKKEFDIDNVEVTVYFGMSEEGFKSNYDNFYGQREFPNRPNHVINKIVDYNIYVYIYEINVPSNSKGVEENEIQVLKNNTYLIDKIKFTDLGTFPFEEYAFNKVEIEDERYEEKYVYNKSYKVTIPKEMFSMEEGQIYIGSHENVYFEDGRENVTVVKNCGRKNYFNYKKEGDKIIIWN